MKWWMLIVACVVVLGCQTTKPVTNGDAYLTNEAEWREAFDALDGKEFGPLGSGWAAADAQGRDSLSESYQVSWARLVDGLMQKEQIQSATSGSVLPLTQVISNSVKVYAAREESTVRTVLHVDRTLDSLAELVLHEAEPGPQGGATVETHARLRIGVIDTVPPEAGREYEGGLTHPGPEEFRQALESAFGVGVSRVDANEAEAKQVDLLRQYLYQTMASDRLMRAAITKIRIRIPEVAKGQSLVLEKFVLKNVEQPTFPGPPKDMEFSSSDWADSAGIGVGLHYEVTENIARARSKECIRLISRATHEMIGVLHLKTQGVRGGEGSLAVPYEVRMTLQEDGAFQGERLLGDSEESGLASVTIDWELDGEYIYLFALEGPYTGDISRAMDEFGAAVKRVEDASSAGSKPPFVMTLSDPVQNLIAKEYWVDNWSSQIDWLASFAHVTVLSVKEKKYIFLRPNDETAGLMATITRELAGVPEEGNVTLKLNDKQKRSLLEQILKCQAGDLTFDAANRCYKVGVTDDRITGVLGWFIHTNGVHTVYLAKKDRTGNIRVIHNFRFRP